VSLSKKILNSMHGSLIFGRRVRVLSAHLCNHLGAEGAVLDVGCGDGSLARSIMSANDKLTFQGCDVFLRPSVAIPAQVYDGSHLPFDDRSFDWTTIVDVLHHVDDPAAVLKECVRVARKGVVLKDHLREGLGANATLRLMDWVGNRGHDVRLPYNYLSKFEWDMIFSRLQLQITKWDEHLGLYPMPFTFAFDRRLHFVATLSNTRA
jgi:SAM-dependent methyltransferase